MFGDENCVIVDWLTFSTKAFSSHELVDYLGLSAVSWVPRSGHNGYKSAYYYGGMWILYDGHSENMGVCCELSGQGCRQYETSGSRPLADLAHDVAEDCKFNVTRVDIAYDDIDHNGKGLLNVRQIDKLARHDVYISKFRGKSGSWSGVHSDDCSSAPLAYSVYFGSPRSDVRFRIYDKAMERGGLDYHWSRFEIQLRDDKATAFLISGGSIGYKFCAVINNYLRFIVPDANDSNRRRWSSPDWWMRFLFHAEKITLYSRRDIEYNLSRLERYIFEQAGNSLYTYIQCVGITYFQQQIKERGDYLNENQSALVAEYAALNEKRHLDYLKKHPYSRF